MSFTDVIGRVGQIESTIAQVSGAQRQGAAQAAAAQASSLSAAAAQSTSGDTDFSAVLRGLTGAESTSNTSSGSGPAGTSASPARSSTGSAEGASAAKTSSTSETTASRDDGGSGSSGGVDGSDVLAQAKKYLGVPYVWGGTDPAVGLDCSGLVQRVFKDLGVDVPRVTYDQAEVGREIPTLAQAEPGDLIVTRNGDHIGIYAGDNKILHAPKPGRDVEIREMFETDADILTIRRVVEAPQTEAAAGADTDVAAAQRSLFESSQRGTGS